MNEERKYRNKQSDELSLHGLDKLPPQAVELEIGVLGAVLLQSESISVVDSILKPESFYDYKHVLIYQAVINLGRKSYPIDILTVTHELRRMGELENAGGVVYVSSLTDRVASSAHLEFHARIICEKYIMRELIKISNDVQKRAYEEETDTFDLLDEFNTGVATIMSENVKQDALPIRSLTGAMMKDVEKRQNAGDDYVSGIPTYINSVDKVLGGFKNSDLIMIAARPAMGKAICVNELLLSDKGWIKMADVSIGDMLAGKDGKFYYVTGVYPQGKTESVRLFFDDKTSIVCDLDHLWQTTTRNERKYGKPASVKTTQEIINSLVSKDNRKNHSIEYHEPIEWPEQNTKIDPYLYGVIIGDGGCSKSACAIHKEELDLIEKCQSLLPTGYYLRKGKNCCYDIRNNYGKHTDFFKFIPDLKGKRSYEKQIAPEYLINSVENRIKLLQGLIDTDGYYVRDSWFEYSTTSEKLAHQIVDLVRSLSGRASFEIKQGKYRKNGETVLCRNYYRINISFGNNICPCSSLKHLSKVNGKKKQYSTKFIVGYEPVGKVETQCISVDSPENLFVTTGNVLTHNTSFILSCALNQAKRGHKMVIFSLEMSRNQLVQRLAAQEAEIDLYDLANKKLDITRIENLNRAIGVIESLPIWIDDTPALSVFDLRAKAIRLKKQHGIEIIYLDYLQLCTAGKFAKKLVGNETAEVSMISKTLKQIAKEVDVPLVSLSQLSRGVESRTNKRPMPSDLRSSGSLEQDSDIIGFLYRGEVYGETETPDGKSTAGIGEVIISKHRNGGTGTAYVRWIPHLTKYCDENYFASPPMNQVENPLPANNNFLNQRRTDNDDTPF